MRVSGSVQIGSMRILTVEDYYFISLIFNVAPLSPRLTCHAYEMSINQPTYQQSHWISLCVTVTQHFCSVILKSLDLRHVNDDSNTK